MQGISEKSLEFEIKKAFERVDVSDESSDSESIYYEKDSPRKYPKPG